MKRQIITILAAALLAMPAATATWRAFGTYEPDTVRDFADGYMRLYPDTNASTKRLYFNVYQTEFATSMNANTGATGSQIQVPGLQMYGAVFGAWKDCNKDGYVGTFETSLVVYPSSVLQGDDSVCTAGSEHNDGQWVWEWIIVGHDPTDPDQDLGPVQIDDPEALVWGDFGLPGAQAGRGCPLSPFPHGTTSGTGHTIRYFDCLIANRIQDTSDAATSAVDGDDDLGLRWDDRDNPQSSDSRLNQHYPVNLFGNPTTGQSGILQLDTNEDNPEGENTPQDRDYAFTTWDRDAEGTCNGRSVQVRDPVGLPTLGQEGTATVGPDGYVIWDPTFEDGNGLLTGNYGKEDQNFTDDEGRYASVAKPDPSVRQPTVDSDPNDGDGVSVATGSYADGMNETVGGIRVGGGDDFYDANVGGDCNLHDDGLATDSGENDFPGIHQTLFFRADAPFEPGSTIKKAADIIFNYFNGAENEGTQADLFGPRAPGSIIAVPPWWWEFDPQWNSQSIWVTQPQSVNRNSGQPEGMRNLTFYGRVGAATFDEGYQSNLGGADQYSVYGSESCTVIGDGPTVTQENGWWCRPSYWYTDTEFNPIVDGSEAWNPHVGYHYQFRDIDCWDGTLVRGVGVRASLVDLASGPCARPPWDPNLPMDLEE